MITRFFTGIPHSNTASKPSSTSALSLTETLASLNRISAVGEADTNPNEAIQDILKEICAFAHWPIAHLYERDPENPTNIVSRRLWHLDPGLDPAATATFRELSENTVFENGKGLIGAIAESAEPKAVADVTALSQFVRADAARQNGVKGFFGFPVLVRGQVVAVAEFFSPKTAELDTLYLELMRNVAGNIARILERERARQLERDRAHAQQAKLRASFESHVRESIGLLGAAAEQLAAVSGQLKGRTQEATTSCQRMKVQSENAAESSARVGAASHTIELAAGHLGERLGASLSAAQTVGHETARAGETVLELRTAADEVARATGMVGTITAQIKMLGLNAAIEAVRAGPHGKGFGVVATEIKALADESDRATKHISRLIMDMQTAVGEASINLEEIQREGGALAERSTLMRDSVEEQKAATTTITSSADTSNLAITTVLITSGELLDTMADVGGTATELSDVSSSILQTAQALDRDSTAFLSAMDEI